jgi:hypothetical protein
MTGKRSNETVILRIPERLKHGENGEVWAMVIGVSGESSYESEHLLEGTGKGMPHVKVKSGEEAWANVAEDIRRLKQERRKGRVPVER